MLQNKELRNMFFFQLFLFVILGLIGILFSFQSYHDYEKSIHQNINYLFHQLLETHPELEGELVGILMSNDGKEIDTSLLEHYHLSMEQLQVLEPVHKMKERMLYHSLLLVLILFILVNLSYMIFLFFQYRRIHEIHHYLEEILKGNYFFSLRDYEEGELSTLKNDLYKVTVRLREQYELAKKDKHYLEEVLSDISHQLKTPLTSMYVINDLLLDDEMKREKQKEFLMKNKMQLERIEWLIVSLLKMSRLDSGSEVLKKEEVNVCELLEMSLEPIRIPIELKGIEVIMHIEENISFMVDKHWTLEALVNILKNAYEHTPKDGSITITAFHNPLYTEINITDTGEGIEPSTLPHIFERFYKGNHNKDSIGIGLHMAKKIIEMQNGSIGVKSVLKEGTTFQIRFYKSHI